MNKWLDWAMRMQAIAQAGLYYSKNQYDLERFEQIRELSAEIMNEYTEAGIEKVKDLFCNEVGYQTPKIDSRAVIIENEKILLVKEKDSYAGSWSMPGGWVDINQSVGENVVKEAKEEAGADVVCQRLIAVQDRNRHNTPVMPYGVCKIFVLCRMVGGNFEKNTETEARGFFSLDALPDLSVQRTTREQIEMCFAAYRDPNWKVLFD